MSHGGAGPGSRPSVDVVVDASVAVKLDCKLVTADQELYTALRAGRFAGDVLWVADPI
jgi:hypothetical protein